MLQLVSAFAVALAATAVEAQRKPEDECLLDWSPWRKYRTTVAQPASTIKRADLARTRANIERYEWARAYRDGVENGVRNWVAKITPEFLDRMIPATTPGDTLFTPCPACRALNKPAHPQGQWKWSVDDADHLTCQICGTVFPNDKYPESIILHAKYGGGQTISYYGGEPFSIFGYVGRPSFSAKIRADKVGFMTGLCRRMAEAYALTGKVEYAEATRQVLLRFADVYPNWLVHVGYGEYADMDPHLAALNINSLPADELCPPPTAPDRGLHSGYWQGGRATGTGMEGWFVRQIVEAYELTCEAAGGAGPVFGEAERLKIEKDLILESTVLLVADKGVNNKSVGNATAVALVGMAMGHPGMVRFGLDVFMKTVDGWFLRDGGTSESWSYALMTLNGIESLGQAFRGYSDPPGYAPANGKRIEKLDLYHDTSYRKVWPAMFNGLQGNLLYPPLADGHLANGIGARFAELMADNYPENSQYLALLKAIAGDDLKSGDRQYAVYYREPGLDKKTTPPLTFQDYVFPVLQIGHLRGGATGRDSSLVLSASDWGGHHHLDSLSLYYWQQGRELLSDLGYLWDHPQSHMTRRTFAHNTVIVDSTDQTTQGRGGKFIMFETSGKVKVMEAESQAYPQATLYRRTVIQVEHGPGRQYVADIFRVQGGAKHEYVFHGPNNDMQIKGPTLRPWQEQATPVRFCLQFHLSTPGAEVYVDDLSITGDDGVNLVTNPSGVKLDDKTRKPAGWGLYHGDGKEEWGQSAAGRGDGPCVYLKAMEAGKLAMNVALIAADSDGYTGPNALLGKIGRTYNVRFWLRGAGPRASVSVIYWPNDPQSAHDRHYTDLTGVSAIAPKPEWTEYGGKFTIPGGLGLENVRCSDQAGLWKATWKMDSEMSFAALWSNTPGQLSLIGEGWGQRDYRNSDVGAMLPYVVRCCPAGKVPTVFVTVFEGFTGGKPVVRGVKRLPVPEAEADNAVLLAVETDEKVDYLVSSLQPRPVQLDTPNGPLSMNGRFAAISVQEGRAATASVVQGTSVRWQGKAIRVGG